MLRLSENFAIEACWELVSVANATSGSMSTKDVLNDSWVFVCVHSCVHLGLLAPGHM